MCKKLVKNSQPFGKKMSENCRGDFFWLTLYYCNIVYAPEINRELGHDMRSCSGTSVVQPPQLHPTDLSSSSSRAQRQGNSHVVFMMLDRRIETVQCPLSPPHIVKKLKQNTGTVLALLAYFSTHEYIYVNEAETKLFQCFVLGMCRTSEIKLQLNNAASGRLKRNNFFLF